MKRTSWIVAVFSFVFFSYATWAATPDRHGYLQVIQIVNFVANTGIASTGMTPTSVTVQFFDDSSGKPCWTTTLVYLGDFTLRAGPGQSCSSIVDHMIITPIPVATLLHTYAGPYTVNLDITKYSHQVTLVQDTAPVFDTASGLVATPGTIIADIQDQYR